MQRIKEIIINIYYIDLQESLQLPRKNAVKYLKKLFKKSKYFKSDGPSI